MKRRSEAATRARKRVKHGTRSVKSAKRGPSGPLETVLALIKSRPGIRPSQLNRLLKLEQSDGLRNTLIKRGLVRKVKDGAAMRYYVV